MQAARREGLTAGQWIEKRVAEWLREGSPTRTLVTADRQVNLGWTESDHRYDQLARLLEAAAAFGQSQIPRSVRSAAHRALIRRFEGMVSGL
jgi:hypothetical protein